MDTVTTAEDRVFEAIMTSPSVLDPYALQHRSPDLWAQMMNLSPSEVPCTHCHKKAGQNCVTDTGRQPSTVWHEARYIARAAYWQGRHDVETAVRRALGDKPQVG